MYISGKMSILRIYFIRHGETDWSDLGLVHGRRNIQLNKKGRESIRKTARYFLERQVEIEAIFTSPLDRAKEAAEIFRYEIESNRKQKRKKDKKGKKSKEREKSEQLELFPDRRLIERYMSSLEGKPKKRVKEILADPEEIPTNVEALKTIGNKVIDLIEDCLRKGYTNVAFFSHSGVKRGAFEGFGMGKRRIAGQHLPYGGALIIDVDGCSIFIRDMDERLLLRGNWED